MTRLTEKEINDGHVCYVSDNDVKQGLISATEKHWKVKNKLGRYEDNDDLLGIDYNTLTKMVTDGLWFVGAVDAATTKPEIIEHANLVSIDTIRKRIVCLCTQKDGFKNVYHKMILRIEKFNKKELAGWALTKEELK